MMEKDRTYPLLLRGDAGTAGKEPAPPAHCAGQTFFYPDAVAPIMKKVLIIKASGEAEAFDPSKVHHALMRAGAGEELADKIVKRVAAKITPGMTTHQIFSMTFRMLNRERPAIASKYDLKGALFRLGPSGHPFERFTAEVLKESGYGCKVSTILHGRCVKHEIDVIATKPGERLMIECKFHNEWGIRCHVQNGLYTYARFLDLIEGNEKFTEPWLVTNTKFTDDLIDYAQCRGLRLLGWDYPLKGSLRQRIDENKLYPITLLQSLDGKSAEQLISAGIVTTKQLLRLRSARRVGITQHKLNALKAEARAL